jgi:radical SAM superfamily enzyme YgiQ (UPF0313 family)
MTGPGEILLVACYELGHQPLAVAWPAAFLERAGYRPAVMDLAVEPLDRDRVRRARLVAISVPMHTALRIGTRVAERVRALNPAAHVCFFGLYAALNAAYLRAHGADSVLGGEVEAALVDLARRLAAAPDAAGADAAGADAAGAAGDGRVLARLDFPAPSRRALPPLRKYAHVDRGDGRREPAGYVAASRGCKHWCAHCPIPPVYGGRFFVVPVDVVLADVRQLVAAGARHVTFGDPDFLNGPRHALAVARAVHAAFPDLTFDFTAKVEHLLRRRDDLAELRALGCAFVVSAVESLSDTVLRHLEKGHTAADVAAALHAVRAAGLALRPTWVPFTPWTTLDDYRAMLAFVAAEDLVDSVDPVQYGIRLLVPPGSRLLTSPALRPHLRGLVAEAFHHEWRHPDPRMDALQAGVAALTARAAAAGEDAAVTFARVRRAADDAAGAAAAAPAAGAPAADRRRPPRLTEAWFC